MNIDGFTAFNSHMFQAISSHGLQSMFSSFTYIIVGMLIRGKEGTFFKRKSRKRMNCRRGHVCREPVRHR